MAKLTAMTPSQNNSSLTFGPTNSVRRYSMPSPSAALTFSTAVAWAFSPPSCFCKRISTLSGAPNSCKATSPRPSSESVWRMAVMSAGPGVRTSIMMPPLKSMP